MAWPEHVRLTRKFANDFFWLCSTVTYVKTEIEESRRAILPGCLELGILV